MWDIFEEFFSKYINLYYPTEEDLKKDAAVSNWYNALNRYIPNGIEEYTGGLSKESLKKLMTVFSYTASVEHTNISEITFNYVNWFQDIPTQVRKDGKLPNIGVHQLQTIDDFATSVTGVTLVDDFSYLAADEAGRKIMQEFTQAMRTYNKELREGRREELPGSDKDINKTIIFPDRADTSVSS